MTQKLKILLAAFVISVAACSKKEKALTPPDGTYTGIMGGWGHSNDSIRADSLRFEVVSSGNTLTVKGVKGSDLQLEAQKVRRCNDCLLYNISATEQYHGLDFGSCSEHLQYCDCCGTPSIRFNIFVVGQDSLSFILMKD